MKALRKALNSPDAMDDPIILPIPISIFQVPLGEVIDGEVVDES